MEQRFMKKNTQILKTRPVMSLGDLILAVGVCDVAYNASRDPRRRKKKAGRPVARVVAVPVRLEAETSRPKCR